MTLQEAIERLTARVNSEFSCTDPENVDDMKLGAAALERFNSMRRDPHCRGFWPLPGETEAKPLHALGFNTGDDESP